MKTLYIMISAHSHTLFINVPD